MGRRPKELLPILARLEAKREADLRALEDFIDRGPQPGKAQAYGLTGDGRALPRKLRPACGVRTRRGEPCGARVVPGKRRCRMHGGLSTGPRTAEGRARIGEAQRQRWARWRGADASVVPPGITLPDEICRRVSEEPEVRAAAARFDHANPSTCRDLCRS